MDPIKGRATYRTGSRSPEQIKSQIVSKNKPKNIGSNLNTENRAGPSTDPNVDKDVDVTDNLNEEDFQLTDENPIEYKRLRAQLKQMKNDDNNQSYSDDNSGEDDSQQSKTTDNNVPFVWIFIAFLVMGFGVVLKTNGLFDTIDEPIISKFKSFFGFGGTGSGPVLTTKWQTFETEFKYFEEKYKEVVPTYGFKVIKSAVRNVIERKNSSQTESISPAMVLLIGSEETKNVLKCLETDLIEAINKAYNESNPIVINGKQSNSQNLINSFEQNFNVDKKHSIIIENIESIGAEDMMSLHQFTDHQNARYKDAIIVMTAINYQKINLTKTARLKQMDEIATQLFQIKWKNHLPEEQGFALISRLTTSVVTIIGQTKDSLVC